MIIGWGAFNFVEGIVDHQLLGLHHVWPAGPGPLLLWDALFLLWDALFLLWGLLFLVGGYLVIRTDGAAAPQTGDEAVAADGRGPE